MPGILGLDIGGANLKAAAVSQPSTDTGSVGTVAVSQPSTDSGSVGTVAVSQPSTDVGSVGTVHGDGTVRFQPFALWKNPEQLPAMLSELVHGMPPHDVVALTMTGELCDCFETRRQGVQAILEAVESVSGQRQIWVWTTHGFVDAATARNQPLAVASANWLALATYAGRLVSSSNGIVIDIGSTTTDIVPVALGKPLPKGLTDSERLRSLELVYSGVRRTPLCAVLGGGVAAELFATTLDVNLVLGTIPENPADCGTADGRPATQATAHARLARMLGADADTCSLEETTKLAERALLRQVYQLTMAFDHVAKGLPAPAQTVVLAGEGEFLARLVLRQQNSFRGGRVISLREQLGPETSRAACAYAVAVLAAEKAMVPSSEAHG